MRNRTNGGVGVLVEALDRRELMSAVVSPNLIITDGPPTGGVATNALYSAVKLYPTGASQPLAMATADFNGDGKPDVAIINTASQSVSIFLNKGAGKFAAAKVISGMGTANTGIVVGDFNGDKKADLAVIGDQLTIALGLGTGNFKTPTHVAAGDIPQFIAAGDFNGDKKLDLAVTNIGGDSVSIFIGKGTGKFNTPTTVSGIAGAAGIAAVDLNKDHKLDLVVTSMGHVNQQNGTFGVSGGVIPLFGNGHGVFTKGTAVAAAGRPFQVAAGDVNGDGKIDLVTANAGLQLSDGTSNVSLLLGTGHGNFGPATNLAVDANPQDVILADVTGDKKLDILTANTGSGDISVLKNKGAGKFGAALNITAGSGCSYLTAFDDNGDKKLDILTNAFNGDKLALLLHK